MQARIALIAMVLMMLGLPAFAAKAPADCGGDGQKICTISSAEKLKHKPLCQGGFIDPFSLKCYRCNGGYKHDGSKTVGTRGVCYRDGAHSLPNRDGEYCARSARPTRWNWKTWKTEEYGSPRCVSWKCPAKTIVKKNGRCLRCPGGYNHHVFYNVNDKRVCQKPRDNQTARLAGKPGCPKGSFFDPRNKGECWSCPNNYSRNSTVSVDKPTACVVNDAARCKSGHYNLEGTCYRKGNCGANGQRACTVFDRNLIVRGSCDKGLKEVLGKGKCIKAKPGEIPFFASIGDAVESLEKGGIQGCRAEMGKLIAQIPNPKTVYPFLNHATGAGGRCLASIPVGFACQTPSVPGRIKGIFKAVSNVAKIDLNAVQRALEGFGKEVSLQYLKPPCRDIKNPTERALCAPTSVLTRDVTGAMQCLIDGTKAGAFQDGAGLNAKTCTTVGRLSFEVAMMYLERRFGKQMKVQAKQDKAFKKELKDIKSKGGKLDARFEALYKEKNHRLMLWRVYKRISNVNKANKVYEALEKIPSCNPGGTKKPKPTPTKPAKTVASASDFIFGIQPNGALKFYEFARAKGWRQVDIPIGAGWAGQFGSNVFAGGPGELYGIQKDGALLYYRYDLKAAKWAVTEKKIGTGWQNFHHVFAASGGNVYAIRKNGDLMAYQHDGNGRWIVGGQKIGTGWGGFRHVFAGGNGIIYVIDKTGALKFYRHGRDYHWLVTGQRFGDGWQIAHHVFATGGGRIYATKSDGNLYAFRHDAGYNWVEANKKIGGGWTGQFGKMIMASLQPEPAQALPFSPTHGWNRLPSAAIDIGAGPEGHLWVVGKDKVAYEWASGKWAKRPGAPPLKRIAVAGHHEVWAVAEDLSIWRSRGAKWQKVQGLARDIGVGAGGHVFAVGNDRNPYIWDGKKWHRRPGSGQDTIDVDPQGNIWIVNTVGEIWRWTGKKWIKVAGPKARDVAVGPAGRVYIVGTDGKGYTWAGGNNWTVNPPSGGQMAVTALPKGPVIVNTSNQIWRIK